MPLVALAGFEFDPPGPRIPSFSDGAGPGGAMSDSRSSVCCSSTLWHEDSEPER